MYIYLCVYVYAYIYINGVECVCVSVSQCKYTNTYKDGIDRLSYEWADNRKVRYPSIASVLYTITCTLTDPSCRVHVFPTMFVHPIFKVLPFFFCVTDVCVLKRHGTCCSATGGIPVYTTFMCPSVGLSICLWL